MGQTLESEVGPIQHERFFFGLFLTTEIVGSLDTGWNNATEKRK